MTTAVSGDVGLMGHLMRRAAFGAQAAELEVLAARGYDSVVDDLLHPERTPRPDEDLLERYHVEHSDEEQGKWTGARWMFRMVNSPRPLEEKLALMWHDVFAAGFSKVVNNPMMRSYYEMLRDHGLGNFGDMLKQLSRNPSMIYYLDQQMNHADAVNENYGRELLELFSMGRGNYTEDDVKACARAFTGWTESQTIPRYPNGFYDSKFVYLDEDHDHSEKTFLGETGNFNGDDIVDIIVRQPATARFVAAEIYNFFVSDDPDPQDIDTLAQVYVDSGHEIREMLKVLLYSDFFKEARFKRVKSPAELVASTLRFSGEHRDPYDFGLVPTTQKTLLMGQQILNPPTVEGWHTGREWIDSSFLIERVNFAAERLGNPHAKGVSQMTDRIAEGRDSISPNDLLEACLYELGSMEFEDDTRHILMEELGLTGDVRCESETDMVDFRELVARLFGLIPATREYQMA
jgi:uncharacterized protein (DUF1800 family)